MSVPNSRNWKAVELPDVHVTGEVEAQSPSLQLRVPQSLDPRILILDLSKVDDGSDFEKVEYRQPSDGRAYDEVEIFYLGQEVSRITVEHPKAKTGKGSSRGGKKTTSSAATKSIKKKAARKKTKKTAKKKTRNGLKKKKTHKKTSKRATRKKRT